MIGRPRARRLALFAILSSPAWVFAAWAILHIFTRPTEFQIDLASYYGGARAFLADSNAYAATNHHVPGGAPGPIFAVPPISLYVFQLLPALEYLTVYYLWLVIKLCALAVLVTVWYRHFMPKRDSPFALLVLVFAYNSALIDDLNLGNIALFEELLIWLAFLALLRGKTLLFCALIIFAAQFKVQPFLLLGLLLVVPERPQWKALIVSMVAGAAAFSTNRLLLPELTREYMRIARTLDQRGANNESTLALVRDLAGIPAGQELHS